MLRLCFYTDQIHIKDNRGMRNLLPKETWALIQAKPDTLFVDVRMEIESLYVGRPPGVHIIAWYEYPDLTPHAQDFVAQVAREAKHKDQTVVLICRSGKRTVDAALALEAAGFTDVVNVLHGFEGDLDDSFHRSTINGWRFDNLPWEQM
jgi:rhodanese-related sulfurtransferase